MYLILTYLLLICRGEDEGSTLFSQEKLDELHLWEMLSHLGDAAWKRSYNEKHRQHTHEILECVKQWTYL